MTDEHMEIESWRYSGRAFFCLPLSSGRIAILCPNRSLYRIVDNWHTAAVVGMSAENFQLQNTLRERATLVVNAMNINTEDIDL
jgi:hypothetical protein